MARRRRRRAARVQVGERAAPDSRHPQSRGGRRVDAGSDRRLLLDALSPEPDWSFDQAIGTTYTLDLLAPLRVPLAATTLPWSEADGEPLANPFALLSALRQHASRISL